MPVRLVSLLLGWILLLATPAPAQFESLPARGDWVTDEGGFLTETERRSLAQKLSAYADSTSSQIVVVTVPSLGGMAASDYATELGRRWQVGQGEHDNGLVILVSREEREVFIATGYGLEGAVPDALAGRIVRNVIVPNFRDGRYYSGLTEAVNIIMEAASGEYTAVPERAPDEAPGLDFATIFVVMVIVFFLINGARSGHHGGGGRRRRAGGLPPVIILGGGMGSSGRRGGFGGGGFGGGGFGGFSGGGGSFGGGGAGGRW